MKNYAQRISEAYANFHQIQTEMSDDALELIANLTSYDKSKRWGNPNLQKAVNGLLEMVRFADTSPSSRLTMLHNLVNAEYVIFPLSHLTVAANRELDALHQMMVDVEGCLEQQVT